MNEAGARDDRPRASGSSTACDYSVQNSTPAKDIAAIAGLLESSGRAHGLEPTLFFAVSAILAQGRSRNLRMAAMLS
jgi:hypothetical protein